MRARSFFITLITVTAGALVINSYSHHGYVKSSSNVNEVTQSPANNLTSTDIHSDTHIPNEKCDFDIAVRNLTPNKCKAVQDIISHNKTRDKAAVQQKIDSLVHEEK